MVTLFGKKDKATKAASTAPKTKPKKEPKNVELLRSVVNESVVGASLSILKKNEAFIISRTPGAEAWAIIVLPTSQIGGLSARFKRDSDKGSLINSIKNDEIATLQTPDMFYPDCGEPSDEALGIIPLSRSLQRMDEYQMMVEATYLWARVTTKGNSFDVEPVGKASYADVVAVSEGREHLSTFIPGAEGLGGHPAQDPNAGVNSIANESANGVDYEAEAEAERKARAEREAEKQRVAEEEQRRAAEQAAAEEEQRRQAEAEAARRAEQERLAEEETRRAQQQQTQQAQQAQQAASAQHTPADDDTYLDKNTMSVELSRRFMKNDLDVTLDFTAFNSTFVTETPKINVTVHEDSTPWLTDQVQQRIHMANAEIEAEHVNLIRDLKQAYTDSLTFAYEKISEELTAPTSEYSLMLEALENDDTFSPSYRDSLVESERDKLKTEMDRKCAILVERAKAEAEEEFLRRSGPEFDRRSRQIRVDVSKEIEMEKKSREAVIYEGRRDEMLKKMELQAALNLTELGDTYRQRREALMNLMHQKIIEIREMIDDNRAADIAYSTTLARDLDADTRIAQLTQEFQGRYEAMMMENKSTIARLENEIALKDEENRRRMDEQAEKSSTRLQEMEETKKEYEQRMSAMRDETDRVKAEARASVKQELDVRNARVDELEKQLADQEQAVKRNNRMMVFLIIILVIIALVSGAFLGVAFL